MNAMIVYQREKKQPAVIGCYPDIECLFSTIHHEVRQHMIRVGQYASIFIDYLLETEFRDEVLQLGDEFLMQKQELFQWHDIGRAYLPVRILNKAESLTKEEYELVKKHTEYGKRALEAVYEQPYGQDMKKKLYNITTYHHERWDGKGYPAGLQGEAIPLEARICAIVDAYDGMSSWKPYRSETSQTQIRSIISGEAGRQFAPKLTTLFVACMDEKLLTLD